MIAWVYPSDPRIRLIELPWTGQLLPKLQVTCAECQVPFRYSPLLWLRSVVAWCNASPLLVGRILAILNWFSANWFSANSHSHVLVPYWLLMLLLLPLLLPLLLLPLEPSGHHASINCLCTLTS